MPLACTNVRPTRAAIFRCARKHHPHKMILICESSSENAFCSVSSMSKRLPRCELLTQNRNARLLHRGVIGELCMIMMWRTFYLSSIYMSMSRRFFRDILRTSTSVHLSRKDVFSLRSNTSTRVPFQNAVLEHSRSSFEPYEWRSRSSSPPICIP